MFSIGTSKRVYFMHPDTPEQMREWVASLQNAVTKSFGKTTQLSSPITYDDKSTDRKPDSKAPDLRTSELAEGSADMSARLRLNVAKGVVKFLAREDQDQDKVVEFWQIWSESIPVREELSSGMGIDFHVATSADMQKLQWRTCGPQNVFIQKMVDFFWNVGAPESEIDRLNDVGALINPVKIGSWIDMSGKGGMDGGWYFPVDIPLKLAIEAADAGEASKIFGEWSEKHKMENAWQVGRDMGAAPPRQTEFKFKIPGATFEDQLAIALDAYTTFNIPTIPIDALRILKEHPPTEQMSLSVITSSEGFVRLGLLAPKPSTETVLGLCALCVSESSKTNDELASFEAALGCDGPAYAEYQYLMKGFGYGVYKEGFDIVFHYNVGEEKQDS